MQLFVTWSDPSASASGVGMAPQKLNIIIPLDALYLQVSQIHGGTRASPKIEREPGTGAVTLPQLLESYLEFLRKGQGVSEATVGFRRLHVTPFLRSLEKQGTISNLRALAPSVVPDYIIRTSQPLSRASRKHLTSGLRSFLRFAQVQGYLGRSMVQAVPVITTRKLDRLPRGIPWEAVQKLLATPDRKTLIGKRDYAILQLLASDGVRIGQAIHLRLSDIDWRQGLISFSGEKGGKSLCFPLREEVAEALLTYVRDRGNVPFSEVFLAVRGQPRPLAVNNHLGSALEGYYRRAGIQPARYGACVFRGKSVTVPGRSRSAFRNEAGHDSGMKPVTDSDFKPVTFWLVVGTLTGIISERFPQGERRWTTFWQSGSTGRWRDPHCPRKGCPCESLRKFSGYDSS